MFYKCLCLQATDGIFDNVPDNLLIEEMHKVQHCKDINVLQQSANSIALMARKLSRDPKVVLDGVIFFVYSVYLILFLCTM